jgi:Mitofissin
MCFRITADPRSVIPVPVARLPARPSARLVQKQCRCQPGPDGHHHSCRSTCRPQSSTRLILILISPFQLHHGPRKTRTLRHRCAPSIHRSSRRQAFNRFHVRIIHLRFCRSECPTAEFSLFSLDTESFISNPTVRSLTEQYLGFGETVFNTLQGAVVTSPYFKRSERERPVR